MNTTKPGSFSAHRFPKPVPMSSSSTSGNAADAASHKSPPTPLSMQAQAPVQPRAITDTNATNTATPSSQPLLTAYKVAYPQTPQQTPAPPELELTPTTDPSPPPKASDDFSVSLTSKSKKR